MDNGKVAERNLSEHVDRVLSSAYYVLAISAVLLGAVVYIITLHADFDELRREHNAVVLRLNDIDIHGTRTLPLVEQRLNNMDIRTQDLVNRVVSAEKIEQKINIIDERQQRVVMDLKGINERIDRIVQALDQTYDRLSKLSDDYNRNKGGGERGPTGQKNP